MPDIEQQKMQAVAVSAWRRRSSGDRRRNSASGIDTMSCQKPSNFGQSADAGAPPISAGPTPNAAPIRPTTRRCRGRSRRWRRNSRPGFEITPHSHARDQLLYAVSGVMRVQTDTAAWIVPPDRAVYLPAGTRHTVGDPGRAGDAHPCISRTAPAPASPTRPSVLEVSDLLRALILALDRGAGPVRGRWPGRADRAPDPESSWRRRGGCR